MPPVTEILAARVIVVEGKDEQSFFAKIIEHMDLQDFQVLPIGGKTKLRSELKALVRTRGFANVKALGIARDADQDAQSAFQSVVDAVRDVDSFSLCIPEEPLKLVGERPSIAVVILPGNNRPGALEDLCLEAVADDSATICLNEYFKCLEKQNIRIAPERMGKAKTHAFLASREKPDLRFGEAAEADYWPFEAKAFESIKTFLRLLSNG